MPRTDDHVWWSFIVSAVSRTTNHARNLHVWSLDITERTRKKEKNTEIISQAAIILNYPLTCHTHHGKS